MAYDMTVGSPVRLQQMLHGYDDGHRLLSSSTKLSQVDMKTVLQLSDSSGPGLRSDADSYLTGYPLVQSGCYALARTWPAPEMPRPGCVWTHTLLIDFADLAIIDDFAPLLSFFVRPTDRVRTVYSATVLTNSSATGNQISSWDPRRAREALVALYAHPEARVLLPRLESDRVDGLVLAIWAQQWPRLRRSFRFCTNSVTDRSNDSSVFDLQLIGTSQGALRSRFPKGQLAEKFDDPTPVWLEVAVRDLLVPNGDGLRQFLHLIGGDVEGGRRAFPYLAQLHADLLVQNQNFSALSNAIDLLTNELVTVEATAIRSSVVGAAARHIAALDDAGIEFLVHHLDLIDSSVPESKAIGEELMRRAPSRFLELLTGDGPGKSFAEAAFGSLPLEIVLDFVERNPSSFSALVATRLDWASSPSFWARKGISSEKILETAEANQTDRRSILQALLTADRVDLASEAVRLFGARLVLEAVIPLADIQGIDRHLGTWLTTALSDLTAVAEVLAAATTSTPGTLTAIARQIHPDAVANEFNEDPWLIAARMVNPRATDLFLLSYLLARALGNRSRSQAELAVLGFSAIHEATARGQLGDDSWSLLSPRLPTSFFGFDWDRCWRLRTGIVDLFLERRLSPVTFASAEFTDELFISLAHWASRSRRGEEFLWKVHNALRSAGNHPMANELERILK